MIKDRLFIPVALVLFGLVVLVLAVRPSPAALPTSAPAKAAIPPSLGLPQTAPGGADAAPSDALQLRSAWSALAAGLVGPLPPNPPTVLLAAGPIQPSPLASVLHLPYVPPSPDVKPEFENEPALKALGAGSPAAPSAPALVLGAMPTPTLTFNAQDFNTNGAGHPPDTNGDVGPDYFMEAVNTSIAIYTKTTGSLATAFTINSFWSGAATGTPCDNANNGDPIVLYDSLHHHWIFMDFAWTDIQNGPYYDCFGVSLTSDPLGNYVRYAIRADDAAHPFLPDYPKGGIWPDGLYFSANMFDCLNSTCGSATYKEARAFALNLQVMEAGQALGVNDVQAKDTSSSIFTLMPSNVRGALPPAGTPNYFVAEDQVGFFWDVFKFHVDFTTPANSTFTGPTQVSQTTYTVAASRVVQPSPGNNIDTLADRLMFLNQYRNLSGTESLWVQHTVGTASASTPTSIQWAQLNVTGGTVHTTPVQQQIFNNGADGLSRFMGSLAVDRQGNAALGYSVSSASVAPDIRYVGRLAADPLNQMPQSETTLLPGLARSVATGSCGGAACTRWGDYSALTVDPDDDCTFWYANMYYPVQGGNWVTRIGSFAFPSCLAGQVRSATTTSLASSANPAVFGQPITLTATVAISGAGAGIPTGVVSYTIDSNLAGAATLSGGVATLTFVGLPVGSHVISATYGGDLSFTGSLGHLAPNQLVVKASSHVAVASSQNPALVGQVVTFTATVGPVAPSLALPTGVVTFTIDSTPVSTATFASGVAVFATSTLITGTHTVSVNYAGDGHFTASAGALAPDQSIVDQLSLYLPVILR